MLKKVLLLTNSNKVSSDIYLPQEKLISLTHPQFLQKNNKNRTKKISNIFKQTSAKPEKRLYSDNKSSKLNKKQKYLSAQSLQ